MPIGIWNVAKSLVFALFSIDHSPGTTVQPAYGLFQESKNDYVVHVNPTLPDQKYALEILNNENEDNLNQATFYHSTTVSPPVEVINISGIIDYSW